MAQQIQDMEKTRELIRAAAEKLGVKIPDKDLPLFEKAFVKVTEEDMTLQEAFGLSSQLTEAIYEQGYLLFQSGKYQDALKIFSVLRDLNPNDGRYSLGMAACFHTMKKYLDAAANYAIYKQIDPLNPAPSFYLYDCFRKTDHLSSALFYLQEALVLAGMDPKYAGLKEKIQIESDRFNEFLKEHFEQKYGKTA